MMIMMMMVTIVLANYFNKNDFDYKILPVIFIMMMRAIDCHGPKFNYDKVLATLLIISIIVMMIAIVLMTIKVADRDDTDCDYEIFSLALLMMV